MTNLMKTYKCSKCTDTYRRTMTNDEYNYYMRMINTHPEEPLGTFNDPIPGICKYCKNKEDHKKKLFLETINKLDLLKDKLLVGLSPNSGCQTGSSDLLINKKTQYYDLCEYCQKKIDDINFVLCSICEAQQPYNMIVIDSIVDILSMLTTNIDILKQNKDDTFQSKLVNNEIKNPNYVINDISNDYKCQCRNNIFKDPLINIHNVNIDKTLKISLILNDEIEHTIIGHPIFISGQKDSITDYVKKIIKQKPYDYNNIIMCYSNSMWIAN
jgi:hypothetical protein